MLWLRRIHLYLGCLFAPALIFFAISGAWQLYRFNDRAKDGSYVPPRAITVLSAIHKNSHLPGKRESAYTPLRSFMFAAAAGLVLSTLLGVVLAFRVSRSVLTPLITLTAGVVIPILLIWIYG